MEGHLALILLSAGGVISIGVLFFPLRTAIILWIISAHINFTGVDSTSSGGGVIGWLNALKVIALPTVLYLRLKLFPIGSAKIQNGYMVLSWFVFIIYAALTYIWLEADLVIPYLKQMGFLVSFVLGYAVLSTAWRKRIIDLDIIPVIVLTITVLGVIQSYVLGNPFGDTLQWNRFVTFTAKQQFAEFILAMFCFLLMSKIFSKTKKFIMISAILIMAALNGGRTQLAGIIAAFLINSVFLPRTVSKKSINIVLLFFIVLLGGNILYLASSDLGFIEQSRLGEITHAFGKKGIEGVGTMKDRVHLWDFVEKKISNFSLIEHLFGKGLSSGAAFIQGIGTSGVKVSSNRVFHDEYIRVYYEMGLTGFLMFLNILLIYTKTAFVGLKNTDRTSLLTLFLPGLLAFWGVENILSSAGNAGGMGISLVLSYALTKPNKIPLPEPKTNAESQNLMPEPELQH